MIKKILPDIIMGIDPGIADTGVGIIKKTGHTLTCLKYLSIKTPSKEFLANRLERLNNELVRLIKEHRPNLMAVEEIFFCKNVKTALVVGHARGVVLLVAKQNNLKLKEFTPLEVKQAVAAYGRADKVQVQKMVKLLLGLKELPRPDDAADALAVAICAANSLKAKNYG